MRFLQEVEKLINEEVLHAAQLMKLHKNISEELMAAEDLQTKQEYVHSRLFDTAVSCLVCLPAAYSCRTTQTYWRLPCFDGLLCISRDHFREHLEQQRRYVQEVREFLTGHQAQAA